MAGVEPTTENGPQFRTTKGSQYASRKTFAQGLMDIALLMANASQLRTMITAGPSQEYYYPNIALISLSILLQLIAGVVLLVLGTMEGKTDQEKLHMTVLNDTSVGLIFAITVINVFVTAFGINS